MQTLLPPVGIAAGVGAALYLREWTMEKPAGMKWTMVRRPRRLLCLDLDGTTYNAEHAVSRANADAIAAAARAGWAVALCTGRSPACQLPTAASLGVDLARVRAAVGFLARKGYLYSTIDEDHHKSTVDGEEVLAASQ